MSLNITLAAPWGIHQCSDYRLTDPRSGKIVEDNAGSKQLDAQAFEWTAKISFTGIASFGGYQTRAWIARVFGEVDSQVPLNAIVDKLVASGNEALRNLRHDHRHLTITIGAASNGHLQVFVISNSERPDGRLLTQAQNHLQLFVLTPKHPLLLLAGMRRAVCRQDRRLLFSLLRNRRDPREIREILGDINERASKHPESHGSISEGCMVSSLQPDGASQGQNIGGMAGIPDHFVGRFNVGEWARKHLRPAPGKQIAVDATSSPAQNFTDPKKDGE